MQVCGREFSEEILTRIRSRVAGDATLTRTALSREVCAWLGWQDTHGQTKDMSSRVALLKLSRRNIIALPLARAASFTAPARHAQAPAQPLSNWLTVDTTLNTLGRV